MKIGVNMKCEVVLDALHRIEAMLDVNPSFPKKGKHNIELWKKIIKAFKIINKVIIWVMMVPQILNSFF